MTKPSALSPADIAAALGVVVIWGLNFVAMKFALRDFTPFQLGAARYVFAALPLVLLVGRPQIGWRWLLAYGLLQGVGQFGFLFLALRSGMTAALASVLMQTQVFFTAILGFMLLRERLAAQQRWSLALAATGLGCFGLGAASAQGAGVGLAALALNLGAAFMWAGSNIVARRAQQASPGFGAVNFVVWSSVVPVLPFVALSLAFDAPETRWRWHGAAALSWAGVAYLGWVATVLAYAMWTGLLKRHAANRVAPFSLGVPVVGLTAGVLVLGERITAWQWGGIAFVAAALAVVMFGGRVRLPEQRQP